MVRSQLLEAPPEETISDDLDNDRSTSAKLVGHGGRQPPGCLLLETPPIAAGQAGEHPVQQDQSAFEFLSDLVPG